MLAVLFALTALSALAEGGALGENIELRTTPVVLDLADPDRVAVGDLIYLGGLRLNSPHRDFGGWSGLWVSPDGSRLVAVGDRGHWLTATIVSSQTGGLIDLTDGQLFPMLGVDGAAVAPPFSDAESIAALDGGLLVAFERAHRFWWYPGTTAEVLATAIPQEVFHPHPLHDAPSNGGVEALTALADGTLLAFAEELFGPDGALGWITNGDGLEQAITLATSDGYVPTGAATMANGDVLILERRFDLLGFRSRIRILDQADIVADAIVTGTQIARLARPLLADNFEAIATVDTPNGTLIYVLSDNNFSVLQRTLLLVFKLDL
ncbi:MAG: esterase-like activity of phytase family protein [Alphaproteobacteria bacterium]|nr:esterase-like activity of phytase family protein [Alphaproteobacteria bacterium]MBT5860829.1 esterase-like activity of phytase family protein [Alphaproteobacteria bacterium]